MPVSSFELNPEMALAADRIENQPNTKAARLPVIQDALQSAESAPETAASLQNTGTQELVSAAPVEIAPQDPPEVTPAVTPTPDEPAAMPIDDSLVSVENTVPKGKKRRLVPVLAIAAALILAVVFCVWQHFNYYNEAVRLATGGLFNKAADDYIFLEGLTSLHDPEFLDYLDGGNALGRNDYDTARSLLAPLAEAGYRNADELLLETDYREARTALEDGEYEKAIRLLKPLAGKFYVDSYDLHCEARLNYGLQLVNNLQNINAVTDGLLLLSGVVADGYPSGRDALAYARKLVYNHGVALYDQDNLVDALDYFSLSDNFADTEKYITLCNTYWGTTTLEELWEIRDFANAEELLMDNYYLCEFLLGNWKTANGNYYFKMEPNTNQYAYYCSYNLPWQYSGDFVIEAGVYMVYHNGGSPRSEFRISITNWNQINIYCFKNGNTYTLYRQ